MTAHEVNGQLAAFTKVALTNDPWELIVKNAKKLTAVFVEKQTTLSHQQYMHLLTVIQLFLPAHTQAL